MNIISNVKEFVEFLLILHTEKVTIDVVRRCQSCVCACTSI